MEFNDKELIRDFSTESLAKNLESVNNLLIVVKQSNKPVKNAYGFILELEELTMKYLSKLEEIWESSGLGKNPEIKKQRDHFYEVKRKLEEAHENHKDNEKCRNVFYPSKHIV